MALVDVRRAYFYAPSRRGVFVALPPEDHQAGYERMRGLLQYSLYGRRGRTKLGGRACIDTQRPQVDDRDRVPMCVWKGCIKGEHVVATVRGDDITIVGERSALEFFIRMMSITYEITKQVIGEDADFEKSGRILTRVTRWRRDGITIEADQRHVTEILKDLDLD